MMNKSFLSTYILASLLFVGCYTYEKTPTNTPTRTAGDKTTYTSAFPTKDVSENLEDIQRSILRITSTAQYTTYFFENQPITKNQLEELDVKEVATRIISEIKNSAGTAITISSNSYWGMLLTNHHVIDYPDTLYRYVKSDDIEPETFLEAVAIKTEQGNYIFDTPSISPFEVIAVNEDEDLALLEVNLETENNLNLKPLDIQIGDSKKLKLGSVLYILGFPKGASMVTRAIVSDPNRDKNSGFLTDAIFNEGISGGIMLASRNYYTSFEWVGMANSSFAEAEFYLIPDPSKSYDYNQFDIYEDDLFVERKRQLNYGITEAIPMQTIVRFLLHNKTHFHHRGLQLKRYQ